MSVLEYNKASNVINAFMFESCYTDIVCNNNLFECEINAGIATPYSKLFADLHGVSLYVSS